MAWGQNPYYYQASGAMPGQLDAYKQQYQTQYQPQYQPAQNPMMQPPQNITPTSSPMQWVQGEAAAKAWSVPPGGSAVLWDSEAPLIYIKSADQTGMPQMRVLRWEEYRPDPPKTESTTSGEFAPISAVRELENRIAALAQRIEEITHGEGLNNGK